MSKTKPPHQLALVSFERDSFMPFGQWPKSSRHCCSALLWNVGTNVATHLHIDLAWSTASPTRPCVSKSQLEYFLFNSFTHGVVFLVLVNKHAKVKNAESSQTFVCDYSLRSNLTSGGDAMSQGSTGVPVSRIKPLWSKVKRENESRIIKLHLSCWP